MGKAVTLAVVSVDAEVWVKEVTLAAVSEAVVVVSGKVAIPVSEDKEDSVKVDTLVPVDAVVSDKVGIPVSGDKEVSDKVDTLELEAVEDSVKVDTPVLGDVVVSDRVETLVPVDAVDSDKAVTLVGPWADILVKNAVLVYIYFFTCDYYDSAG